MKEKTNALPSDYLQAYLRMAWQTNPDEGLRHWVEAFQRALDGWQDDECRRLLRQIKAIELTPEIEGLVRYIEGRWAEQGGDLEHAISCYRASLALNQDVAHSWRRAQVLGDLGLAYQSLGRLAEAEEALLTALAIYRAGDERDAVVEVLSHLATVATSQGRMHEALRWLDEAMLLAQTIEERSVLLANKGAWCQAQGETATARKCLEDALATYQGIGDVVNSAHLLNNIGLLALEQGEVEQARTYLTSALTQQQSLGDWGGAAATLANLALLAQEVGDLDRALDYLTEAIHDLETLEDVRATGTALNARGLVYAGMGDWQTSLSDFERGLELARYGGDQLAEIDALNNLGTAYRHLSRLVEAEGCYLQALTLAETLGQERQQGHILGNLGHLWAGRGDNTRARGFYQQSQALAEACADYGTAANSLLGLCGLTMEEGDLQALPELLQRTWELAEISMQFDLLCRVTWIRGDLALMFGDYETGLATYAESTVLAEIAGSGLLDATLERLAIHLRTLDACQLAAARRQLGDAWEVAGLMESHPEMYSWLKDLPSARDVPSNSRA